jgi:hypothetical protein
MNKRKENAIIHDASQLPAGASAHCRRAWISKQVDALFDDSRPSAELWVHRLPHGSGLRRLHFRGCQSDAFLGASRFSFSPGEVTSLMWYVVCDPFAWARSGVVGWELAASEERIGQHIAPDRNACVEAGSRFQGLNVAPQRPPLLSACCAALHGDLWTTSLLRKTSIKTLSARL